MPSPAHTLPTQRLSPKNQVTLPREARSFLGLVDGGTVCGLTHQAPPDLSGEGAPILVLLTEPELERREQRILEDPALDPERRFALITRLNGSVRRMAVDAQHRVVLPAHFVAHLGLERDLFYVCTNTTVQLWNPDHYLRWSGKDLVAGGDPRLNAYLMI